MSPAEIVAAAKASARGPARAIGTFFLSRGANKTKSGWVWPDGTPKSSMFEMSVMQLGTDLLGYSRTVLTEKGSGLAFTLGTSGGGGNSSAECLSHNGVLLDSDKSGDWTAILTLISAARLAYLAQRRGKKFHVSLFFVPRPYSHSETAKGLHRFMMRHVLKVLGEAAGVEFDPSQATLMPLTFAYTELTSNPGVTVETLASEGAALDLAAFATATGFKGGAPAATSVADLLVMATAPQPELAPMKSYDLTRAEALQRLSSCRLPERQETIRNILAGKPFAKTGEGERDTMIQRVASWLTWYSPSGDPEALADILEPSRVVMEAVAVEKGRDVESISRDTVFEKIVRAGSDQIRHAQHRKTVEDRIRAALIASATARQKTV